MLLFVAALCAMVALAGTRREDGLAAPAGIGIGAGLVSASAARALDLPSLLPVTLGALVCPAVWAVLGTVVIVGVVRLLLGARARRGVT